MTDRRTVSVYVRAPDNDTRTLSFPRIPDVSAREALKHGYAVDGNSYVMGLESYLDENAGRTIPLLEALLNAERDLVDWFEALGLTVDFK